MIPYALLSNVLLIVPWSSSYYCIDLHPPSSSVGTIPLYPIFYFISPLFYSVSFPIHLYAILVSIVIPHWIFTSEDWELGTTDEKEHVMCVFLCLDYLKELKPPRPTMLPIRARSTKPPVKGPRNVLWMIGSPKVSQNNMDYGFRPWLPLQG